MQTSLADANGVADEVLASMTTVKAHAAEASANKTYADRLHKFYILQVQMAASLQQHLPAYASLQAYGSTCKPTAAPAISGFVSSLPNCRCQVVAALSVHGSMLPRAEWQQPASGLPGCVWPR